jgi:DNA-binding beta-propeller fold protein YncE
VSGDLSKKVFCVALLALFVSFALNVEELPFSYKRLTVNAEYDPMTVVANITLGKRPYCVAANNETNRVYVGVDNGLIVVDGETDLVLAEIPLSDDAVALEVNPSTNRIYAGVYGENVTVIDGATNLKVGEIPERLYNSYELAVNPITNLVYVGDWTTIAGQVDSVRVYDGENFQSVTSVALGDTGIIERVGVAVNPSNNKVYATWTGNTSLFLIDGNTHLVTNNVVPSYFSRTTIINSYTNYVYVGTAILNGETLEEVTPTLANVIRAADPLHNLVYTVSSLSNLSRLDGSTHGSIDSLKLHWSFSSIYDMVAVNTATSKVYITNYYGNETVVVSAGAPVIPEFPSDHMIPFLLVATLTGLVICKRKLRKSRSMDFAKTVKLRKGK